MTAYFASALGVIGLAALAACSSKSGGSPAACDACDGGQNGSTPTVLTGHDTNLDGVPYPTPTGGYGHVARRGLTPGSIMQNFKFLGYPNADKSKGLQTIALADYYDPCGKRLTMLHLTVAGVWCVPCNQETDAIVAAQAELA